MQLLFLFLRLLMPNKDYDLSKLVTDDLIPQSASKIFEEIRAIISTNNQIKNESQKPYAIILKNIILSGIDAFQHGTADIMDFVRTIVDTERQSSGCFLRFSSHLALVFRFSDLQFRVFCYFKIKFHYKTF